MAIANLSFMSDTLAQQVDATVILPDNVDSENPPAVWYFLPGLKFTAQSFAANIPFQRHLAGSNVALVIASLPYSWYFNNQFERNYFDFTALELPQKIESMFHVRSDRAGRFVGGCSMGGFGSLKTALTFPERFAGVTAFSPACDFTDRGFVDGHWELHTHLSQGLLPEDDVYDLARKVFGEDASREQAPAVWVTCGTDDPFLAHAQRLEKELHSLGVQPEVVYAPGPHAPAYWDTHFPEALAWVNAR
ncbi:alpha/beta hydrolase [Actinotignum urinale]|uniref:alpha/beta hydrolase n=1 Tax=Actinotignum urinale TaxID=190146 RepID=UPI00280BEB40|nr:alpha/beta hydrolase-fold protein [Actinotignum urinale]